MQLAFSTKNITRFIITVNLFLIFMHVGLHLLAHKFPVYVVHVAMSRFDANSEASVPTWFSEVQLLTVAVFLALIAYYKRSVQDAFARQWAGLAFIFLFLSMDEGASLHELIMDFTRDITGTLPGFLQLVWVVPFIPLVFIVFLAYWKFLKHLPAPVRRNFLIAGGLFVTGALVMEMVGAQINASGMPRRFSTIAIAIEEGLEMIGCAWFLITQIRYIRDYLPECVVKFIE
jgi:hypothetical protein